MQNNTTDAPSQRNIHAILQQRRLRHITGICLRNLTTLDRSINTESDTSGNESNYTSTKKIFFQIINESTSKWRKNSVIFESSRIDLCSNPGWLNFEILKTVQSTSSTLQMQLWLNTSVESPDILLLKWNWDLSRLSYIAERLHQGEISFSQNALIVQINGSFYSLLQCFSTEALYGNCPHFNLDEEKGSCNRLSLKRMLTCHRSITQAKHRTSEYVQSAELLMQQKELHRYQIKHTEDLQKRVKRLKLLLLREASMLKSERNQFETLQKEMRNKNEKLSERRSMVFKERDQSNEISDQLVIYRQRTRLLIGQLTARHIEVLSELAYIFPIKSSLIQNTSKNSNSVKNQIKQSTKQTPAFTICDIHLPDAESLIVKDDSKNAVAMGYVSQMLYMISYFLLIPLRYPLVLQGSQSSIIDNVIDKIQIKERLFPLYSKSSKERFLFEYAIYLVNKNIGQMRYLLGLPTSDLRPTLYNVKSLLEHAFGDHQERFMSVRMTSHAIVKTPRQKSPQPHGQKDTVNNKQEQELLNEVKKMSIDLEEKVHDKSMELNSLRGELFGSKKGLKTIPRSPRHVSPNVERKTAQNSPSKGTSNIPQTPPHEDVSIILADTSEAGPVFLTGLEDLDKSPKNEVKSENPIDAATARNELFKKKSGRPVITKKHTYTMRPASSRSENYFSTTEQYFKSSSDINKCDNNTECSLINNKQTENISSNLDNNNMKIGYAPLAIEEEIDLC